MENLYPDFTNDIAQYETEESSMECPRCKHPMMIAKEEGKYRLWRCPACNKAESEEINVDEKRSNRST